MIAFNNRFHGHGSLRFVYQNGRAVRTQMVNIRFTQNKHRKESRIAVIVSKKTHKSAVSRNKVRRRVYEYIRTQLPRFTDVFDVVIIVSSKELLSIPYNEIISHLSQALRQAGILKTN